jgi:hypothetical protein
VLRATQRAARLHEVEDVVAPLDDLRCHRDLEFALLALLVRVGVGRVLVETDLFGVAHEVEPRRRLRDRGQDRELGEAEVLERLPEVAACRRLHAVGLVAVEVLVEVGSDDVLLALVARVGLGQPDRLDDLAHLALIGRVGEGFWWKEAGADELLGDRRRTTRTAGERIEAGADDRRRVEAGVRPKELVLDRGRGIEHLGRDVLEARDLTPLGTEPRELHLAGPVVDDRLLLEAEVLEGRRGVGQAL